MGTVWFIRSESETESYITTANPVAGKKFKFVYVSIILAVKNKKFLVSLLKRLLDGVIVPLFWKTFCLTFVSFIFL